MTHYMGSALLWAVQHSWTLQKSLSFLASPAGIAIKVPVMLGLGLHNLTFEQRERRFMSLLGKLLASRPGAVIDVGANIGRFLIYLLHVDRERPYIGFDVHIACANYIEEMIRANDLRHHAVFACGLSDHAGVVTLRTNDHQDVSATTTREFYTPSRLTAEKPVLVDTGDNVLSSANVTEIALVKIDVEGGEIEVLRGLSDTLAKARPSLIIEVAPYQHMLASTDEADYLERRAVGEFRRRRIPQLEALLRGKGYEFFWIGGGDNLHYRETLDPGESTDIQEMDYLCVPTERVQEAMALS